MLRARVCICMQCEYYMKCTVTSYVITGELQLLCTTLRYAQR